MDNNNRMKVKDLAKELNQDTKIIRQKLTVMGFKTFSDESEVSGEACEKIRELLKQQTAAKVTPKTNQDGTKRTGGVRRVVRKEAPKPAEEEVKKPDVVGVADSGLREGLVSAKESKEAAQAEAKTKVRRKLADAPKEEPKPEAPAEEKAPSEEKPEEKPAEPEVREEKPKAPEINVAPVRKGRSAGIAGTNESFSFDLGGSSVSKQREEFDKARKEAAVVRPRVRRETSTDNAMLRRQERKNQENQNRFGNRDNRNGNRQGGFNSYGGFDKDKDSDERPRFTQSPNKSQSQKPVEHIEQGMEQRREKTGDKDNAKKDKRMEGTRRTSGVGPITKEGKYNSARQFIGGKMDVSEVESDDFNYSGSFDVSDRVNRKANKKRDKEADAARKEAQKLTKVKIPPTITVKNFAELIKKTAAEVVKKLMLLGIMATMNQEIDFDTACLVANDFGIEAEAEIVVSDEEILLEDPEDLEIGEDACERPPVVVVMGHVDHGKTSLLDAIRQTNVTKGEAGGITQAIGAYTVTINDHKITFLDTPGHEAFTAMRARGAQVTDVAIIVVAADDGVMPQTIEAINHAKAANVSIVVAVNKIDKEGANPERVMTEMAEQGIVCEEWGGDVPFVQVSAKQGLNIDTLLETVILSADILELKASPTKQCKGTVIEAKLDKNKGPVATLLVQRGTLRSGDAILTESTFGHIRTMVNDKGRTIKEAGPSTPVEITGLPEVPEAGKVFYVVNKDEKLAKKVAEDRMSKARQTTMSYSSKVTLEGLFSQMQAGEVKDLNIIVKADVKGSAEAIKASLEKLSNDEVRVCVIHNAVGGVSESDVLLAEASNAVIIGFNVRPIGGVGEMAAEKGVDLKLYRVIYDAIDDVKAAMVGMLKPEFKETVIGHVEIRQTFKISGVGTIAGGYVLDGKVVRNSKARIVRDSIVIYEGNLASLKRFKDDAKEVAMGYECGLSFEKFDDLKEGDVIESYIMEEVQRTI